MNIRRETESDITAINEITAAAFKDHPYSHQTEVFIIKALRAANALTLSLVAEVEGKVVGHIAFSPVAISDGSERTAPEASCRFPRHFLLAGDQEISKIRKKFRIISLLPSA